MTVLGIPVINRPDLLARCLASVDIDATVVVIDNSGTGELADVAFQYGALPVEPAANLGVAASWNHIIRSFPGEDSWLIANADVEFGPGDLQRLLDEPGGWVGVNGDWRVFKLTAAAVERVGFFDENFVPIYCEDADYEYRCTLAGVDWHFIDGETTHVGSVAIHSGYSAENARTYPANVAYFEDKWGGSMRGGERFRTPFDRGGGIDEWTLSFARIRDQRW